MLLRLLFLMLAFPLLATALPVPKAEPFVLYLVFKANDGRTLRPNAGQPELALQTNNPNSLDVKDWNGTELVAGDVISLTSLSDKVQLTRVGDSQELTWQKTQPQPGTRFVVRKLDAANGSPIATGDRLRLELFGEKDTYLGNNARLVHVTTPGPEQTWLVRRITFGNQAARKVYSEAFSFSREPGERKALYEKAFALGALDAMGGIGDMYMDGKFGSVDMVQASAYYRKGAEAGDPAAMFIYGATLYYGKGVSQDKAEAVRWEQQAARLEHSNAVDLLKKWGEPVPGVAVAAAAPPKPAPPVSRLLYPNGTMLLRDGSPEIFIIEGSGDRYKVLIRKYSGPGDYFWTGNEFGRYRIDESWVDKAQLENGKLKAADKKYRTCDGCNGEGCVMEQMTSRRGGYNYVKDGAVYHVSEYDKPTYKRQQRCPGCGGQGWIPGP